MKKAKIHYIALEDEWRKEEKLRWFVDNPLSKIAFEMIRPDKNANWINLPEDSDWDSLISVFDKENKSNSIVKNVCMGLSTNRDEWVYDFSKENLKNKVEFFIDTYSDLLIKNDNSFPDVIKWSRDLKNKFEHNKVVSFNEKLIISASYRPFTNKYFYAEKILVDRLTENHIGLKTADFNKENRIFAVNHTSSKDFNVLATSLVGDLHFNGDAIFVSLYQYDKDGNRIENISDWALSQFQEYYEEEIVVVPPRPPKGGEKEKAVSSGLLGETEGEKEKEKAVSSPPLGGLGGDKPATPPITKEAIFHYIYAVLHNPAYRQKYELNLKRDFPRIPFYSDFAKWAAWGKTLMDLHIGYESVAPYPLSVVNQDVPEGKNEKVMLKADKIKGSISLTDYCTLKGIPAEAWEYKLGNRSALEWVLDQYKEAKPSDATIRELFNSYKFADYKAQVVDLLLRVCAVSVGTMAVVREMGEWK